MLARLSSVVVAFTLFLAVAASPAPSNDGSVNQCNGGSIECCKSTEDSKSLSKPVAALLQSLHIQVGSLQGLVGVTCSPVTGIGASGTSCTSQQVCCTNNNFNGVVALGCTPINASL